ncbi:DoxX family protein [Isosphaeraceae bacterium EP7]
MATIEREKTARDLGLLAIRLIIGVVFLYHGSQKLFGAFGGPGLAGFSGFLTSLGVPAPGVNAVLAGSAEFFGGAAMVLGLLTRLAAIPMVATMAVAILTVHSKGFNAATGGMEYPLTLLVVVLGLGLTGAGGLSLDALLARRRHRSIGATEATRLD